MHSNRTYILGSSSPRRIDMMREHGIDPIIMPASIEENLPQLYTEHEDVVMFLAFKKAKNVEAQWLKNPNGIEAPIIISADTVVYKDGEIMGKPVDFNDGFRMLSKLRNTYHYVTTGVALLNGGASRGKVFYRTTKVFFTDFTDEELKNYLTTKEAYDKAGAYAIQGYFSKFIHHIEGDINTVIGFPWDSIEKELKEFLEV